MKSILRIAAAIGLAAGGAAAAAAEVPANPWFLHVGPGRLALRDKAVISAGGAVVPGAGLDTKPQWTAIFEFGRFVTSQFAVSFTGGIPPKVKFTATGAIAPYGYLGSAVYGPTALTVTWHPLSKKSFDPYVGAGVSYMHIFKERSGAMLIDHIDDDIGPAFQGGVNLWLTPQLGLFADVKKALLRTTATGTLGGYPAVGKVKMDPTVFNAGVSFRF